MDKYLDRASEIFPFKDVEEQKRIGKNNIEKRHFKFTYDSPINNRPFYILLDVLFEHNHYSELVQKEIQNDLLLTEPEYLTVSLPSANCMKLQGFSLDITFRNKQRECGTSCRWKCDKKAKTVYWEKRLRKE